jgi:hypothetical protein
MNVAIFWETATSSLYVNRRFGGTYHLHLRGRKSAAQETSVQQVADGDTFLRNVGSHTGHTARYPGRWKRSLERLVQQFQNKSWTTVQALQKTEQGREFNCP